MTDLVLETWPIGRLIPYARNARTHSDEQVAELAASFAEFGFNNPCLVDEQGVLIAGHGRVLAARRLGMEIVPVIVLAHLSDAQKKAFRIADNKLALNAGWNQDLLRQEVEELLRVDYDPTVTGYSGQELEDLLGKPSSDDAAGGDGDEDSAPEPPAEPVSRPGDLWRLGNHRLLCGNATVLADVERALGGGQAAMCFTDSPYNVDYGAPGKGGRNRRILNDALGDGFGQFLTDACVNILTVTSGAGNRSESRVTLRRRVA